MARILFVCLGNICRSPTAEGLFAAALRDAGLEDRVRIDSAGTGSWHVGSPPDRRSQQAARQRGIDLSGLRARQVEPSDFAEFDLLLAMDRDNLSTLEAIRPKGATARIALMLEFSEKARRLGVREVPDPYTGEPDGFEHVLDLLEDACDGLLAHVRDEMLHRTGRGA